jgi:NAD(P)-dependent dehydrogenase (short-subunit alcohol dehydrogenase family)
MSAPELSGRTALVTGAPSEVGLATARLLRRDGAHVLISDRDAERGKAAAAELGLGTRFIAADLADLDSVDHLARQMPIDILVNTVATTDVDTLSGLYFLVASVIPGMIRHGGGAIVSLTSEAGAVAALTRTWAAEFGAHGVRVNSVAFRNGANALGRDADPTEFAEAILFLVSPRASFVTGATLNVDGGASIG